MVVFADIKSYPTPSSQICGVGGIVLLLGGILNKNKSNDVARYLPCDVDVFKKSLSKYDVLVIFNVWVIADVHPVDTIPLLTFSYTARYITHSSNSDSNL